MTRVRTSIAVLMFFLSSRLLYGQAVPAPNLKNVGFDQRLNEQVPLDLSFNDEAGKPVKLGDYFQGKPVVLILYYARCPMLCPLVLRGVTRGMMKVPLSIGKDYTVLSVSFDPKETPATAAANRETYVQLYNRPGAGAGWHFLTGKEDAIAALTKAVGFRYQYDAKRKQFVHAAGIVVLTPSGKISRYLYGIDYAPRDLRLALVEASASKIGSPADQVLLYCFHYDPSAGKYTANVMAFIRAGGVLTLTVLGALVWIVVRKRRHHDLAAGVPTGATPGPSAPREEASRDR